MIEANRNAYLLSNGAYQNYPIARAAHGEFKIESLDVD